MKNACINDRNFEIRSRCGRSHLCDFGPSGKCYPVSNQIEMEEGSTKKYCKKLFSLFGFLGGFPC